MQPRLIRGVFGVAKSDGLEFLEEHNLGEDHIWTKDAL